MKEHELKIALQRMQMQCIKWWQMISEEQAQTKMLTQRKLDGAHL
jgi:hypothetical protein